LGDQAGGGVDGDAFVAELLLDLVGYWAGAEPFLQGAAGDRVGAAGGG
jgi:hypothetical protein